MYYMKKAAQKTKQNKRYRKKSDIVSKVNHRSSRVRNPCFKSLTKGQRSVRTFPGTRGRFRGRFDSKEDSSLAIGRGKGHGKDLTRVQGYLRTVEGQTSLTFWLDSGFTRTTRNNKSNSYRNSQGRISTKNWNQKKPFGAKTAKNKSFKRVQEQKFSKLPVRRNKLTRNQKKNFGKILLPYFGKQIV
jgi:hypothetical protein